MSLISARIPQKEAPSSIHLDDIPENNPLYAQLQAYLSQKQCDTFAFITKEEADDIKSNEKVTKARERGNYRGRGRSSPGSSGSSYGSSSSSLIIQSGGMSLISARIPQKEASSLIHLDDIPQNNPLYAQLQAYLSQKQSDTFASTAK
ncbi:hypothetical protein H5410_004786 [Solanum commersonii]|uniref:Uncharacterized protein n=1 Tax=Solanum commersonii TaxID=4109 RepID=A0A9J6A5B3_SOLCO|nr:hypothetical protein H5410_004786 [Solanum commersonii]